jgi:hypothetical protein
MEEDWGWACSPGVPEGLARVVYAGLVLGLLLLL